MEAPESQVDAWASIMVLLRHLMLDKAQRNFLNHQAFDMLTWTVLGWFSSPGTRFFNSLTGSDRQTDSLVMLQVNTHLIHSKNINRCIKTHEKSEPCFIKNLTDDESHYSGP